jgi:nitrogen-specific signal transduction histidine kinase
MAEPAGWDLLPDAVLAVAPDGTLAAGNAAAVELLGEIADRTGRPAVEALGVRDPMGEPVADDAWPAPGTEVELVFAHADGSDVPVTVTARRAGGGTVLCARPVGDRSGIAIISTVSHELRSPLTSVKGYVSLMLNRWERIEDDKKREMLAQVHHDADRVTRLVTELLDISRLETGRLVLRRQMVDVGAIAATVVDKVRLSYPDLDCAVHVADDAPEVYADPDKLEQVLTNLVENAAKYGALTGMRIDVGLDPAGDVVTVSVSDTGEGIPEHDLPRVFTKFFRRDHGRPTGTGLGLWISRGLVEAHGGELTASSPSGQGATFTFTLPTDAFEQAHGG